MFTPLSAAKGIGANYATTGLAATVYAYAGKRWLDGAVMYTGFNTLLAPNAPQLVDQAMGNAVVNASSFHPGGVNAVLGDGAVRFFSETISTTGGNGTTFPIDKGPQTEAAAATWAQTSGKSWHGVWGALGSRNGGESASAP